MAVALELDPGDYSGTYTPVLLDQVAEPPAQADAAPVEVGDVNELVERAVAQAASSLARDRSMGLRKTTKRCAAGCPGSAPFHHRGPGSPAAAAISDARQVAAP
jgi:hypothetical protein